MGSDTEQDRSECLNFFSSQLSRSLHQSSTNSWESTSFVLVPQRALFSVRLPVISIIDKYLLFFARVCSYVAGVIDGSDGIRRSDELDGARDNPAFYTR